eukprot:c27187_g1_i1 orf=247-1761(+)
MAQNQRVSPAVNEFDDIDDILISELGVDPGNSSTRKRAQEIFGHLCKGNFNFRNGNYEEAIHNYSEAYKLRPADPTVLLSNRSAAFCKLSQQLRKIPASYSEEHALYGLDPMSHAELALKDSEKLLKLNGKWLKGYYRKGRALILLEQYDEAREAFLNGLCIDPMCIPLQAALHELNLEIEIEQQELANGSDNKRKQVKVQRTDDFECTLCLKLLYNPVTTPCGHSFCRQCLLQAMDHGNKCPMCRTILFVSPRTYPTSVTLRNIIQKNFPEEYAERKEETDNTTVMEKEILPLFVMDVVLPYQKISLNIFEPRYRLMVRRVMEGNHRMGMVGFDPKTGSLADTACEVAIIECEPLPDGRFYLEVEGCRRCHIIKTWEQDGYRVGQVAWIQDSLAESIASQKEVSSGQLQELTMRTADLAQTWIACAQETSQTDRHNRFSEMLNYAEGMPEPHEPERFSFWVANLLHMKAAERLDFLRLTDTHKRLVWELSLLQDRSFLGRHVQ